MEFHSRDNRGTALHNKSDCRGKDGPKLGVRTSPNRTPKGCVCFVAGTVVVGREGVFVVIRGV